MITKFVPGVKIIKDHRSNPTGYYEAVCDVCETLYYPRRSNSKYCSPNCGVVAHRNRIAKSGNPKKVASEVKQEVSKPKKEKTNVSKPKQSFVGAKNVYLYLKSKFDTRGYREIIIKGLKNLKNGESFDFDKVKIRKVSSQKYELV